MKKYIFYSHICSYGIYLQDYTIQADLSTSVAGQKIWTIYFHSIIPSKTKLLNRMKSHWAGFHALAWILMCAEAGWLEADQIAKTSCASLNRAAMQSDKKRGRAKD